MQLLASILNFVFSDWNTFATCVGIGWVTYKLFQFYYRALSLPKGPTPLPVVGNILSLRGTKCNTTITFTEMAKVYGPVFTFWLSHKPIVFINDLEVSKEAFKKPEFSGRMALPSFDENIRPNDERCDISLDQFGHRWESTRRVAHAAVRKYAVSDRLLTLVNEVMEEFVNDILKKEGDKPFDPDNYIRSLYFVILHQTAFGKRHSINDPELNWVFRFFEINDDPTFVQIQFLRFLRPFYRKFYKNCCKEMLGFTELIISKFVDHIKDFDENQIRDFCDALLLAKKEAIEEAKESAPYLTNDNLGLAVLDLFLAGSETSARITRWFTYLMANHPDYQRKMREEVASVIGDRMPLQEDARSCHFVYAFIHEVLRFRPAAPISVPHKTMVDVKLENYLIPQDTYVIQNIWAIHQDPNNFPEPELFKPERFLDSSGRFMNQKPAAFIPFGSGRRSCLGEKLALADIFLVVANLLQKTNGYEVALKNGPGTADLEMDPNINNGCVPKKYEIVFKRN